MDHTDSAAPPALPPRPENMMDHTNAAVPPALPPRPKVSDPTGGLPPTRAAYSTQTNQVAYERDPERLVGYIIPLPRPVHNGVELDVPQRYMLYTPPAPDLLKPAEGKEKKRYRVKRWWQRQVKTAKTYDGKTASFKGLHSKSIRAALWALGRIERTDVTFLARVPRKTAARLVLVHPHVAAADGASARRRVPHAAPAGMHAEFTAQLHRTSRLARRDAALSVAILPAVAVFDFFFPLGGLTEINLIWLAANVRAYHTGRSMLKRIGPSPPATGAAAAETDEAGSEAARRPEAPPGFDEHGPGEPRRKRRGRGTRGCNKAPPLQMEYLASPAMVVMTRYLEEQCHRRSPRAFRSAGVPPTQSDVLASIGWEAERRGRDQADEHEDVQWQTRQAKDDMHAVAMKAARSWDKWCKKYAKYPERVMEEKGHSTVSVAMYRMKLKKDKRNLDSAAATGEASTATKSKSSAVESLKSRLGEWKKRCKSGQAGSAKSEESQEASGERSSPELR